MNFRQNLQGDAGLTLVETLAGIALFSVVIFVASGFLFNGNGQKQVITSAVEQQRETIALVQEMRRAYADGTGVGTLTLRPLPEGLSVQSLALNGVVVNPTNPTQAIDFEQTLVIDVTTVTETGETMTLQTAVRSHTDTLIEQNP